MPSTTEPLRPTMASHPLPLNTITSVPEKLCSKCGECWPADTEFFYRQAGRPDGLGSMCKACYAETPSMIRRNAGKKKLNHASSPWEALFADAQEVQHAR
ncbi:hypothetical protein [Stutzerimonas stutzeri]|uniref:hypothetical protein n=1 Tax=Stutzerimonas stutzeri TaxID=316 RepID=UPI0021088853|nr:hypothetical protein [Stutzerimonas stutzeri]MCQ4242507.1 hypothetical protein [Stutzerimonas stutzeri]